MRKDILEELDVRAALSITRGTGITSAQIRECVQRIAGTNYLIQLVRADDSGRTFRIGSDGSGTEEPAWYLLLDGKLYEEGGEYKKIEVVFRYVAPAMKRSTAGDSGDKALLSIRAIRDKLVIAIGRCGYEVTTL